MESLFKKLLEKAGSEGGEEWLKRCLVMWDIVPEDQPAERATGFGSVSPSEQQRESASVSGVSPVRARRSQPPERAGESQQAEEAERRRGACEEEDGGGGPTNVRRSVRQKRNMSQSPARGNARRGRAVQPAARVGRGRPLPPRSPRQPQVSVWGQEQHISPIRQEPAAGMLREEPGPAVNAQPPAVGECVQLQTLNAIMDSLSSLVRTLTHAGAVSASPVSHLNSNTIHSTHSAIAPVIQTPNVVMAPGALAGEVNSPGRVSVPEACMKEVMPCEMSPLGYHLSTSVKEKIWRGEFMDILSPLPSQKDFMAKSEKNDKHEDDRRRPIPRSFNNWLQAFCVFAGVMTDKYPERSSGLFQHVDHILEAYKSFGGLGWFYYDEFFRQKLAVHPSLRWGMKDVGLWLNLLAPQRSAMPKPAAVSNSGAVFRKGSCFAFNDSQCRWNAACKYRHECSYCAGAHPAAKCLKKSANAGASSSSRDIFPKSLHASEAGKYAPMAGNLSRPGDGAIPQ